MVHKLWFNNKNISRWPIYFYGTRNIAWVPESKLVPLENVNHKYGIPAIPSTTPGKLRKYFQLALEQIEFEPFNDFQFSNTPQSEDQMTNFLKCRQCQRNKTTWDDIFPVVVLPNVQI